MVFLNHELLGPREPEEILAEPPSSRYLCGMLAPAGTTVDSSEDDTLQAAEEDDESGSLEASSPLGSTLFPSSVGMSFLVEESTAVVAVHGGWGVYERVDKTDTTDRVVWKRMPVSFDEEISLTTVNSRQYAKVIGSDIRLEWIIRALGRLRAVSLFLVNGQKSLKSSRKDERWIFQPALEVTAKKGVGGRPFLARDEAAIESLPLLSDADLQSNELLYRERHTYAIGHGAAAKWDDVDQDARRAGSVGVDLLPQHEVPLVVPRLLGSQISMAELATIESAEQASGLIQPMLEAYQVWIDGRRSETRALASPLAETARVHLAECELAHRRMQDGLRLLAQDSQSLEAFRFANEAMLLQRSHSDWAASYRKTSTRVGTSPTLEGVWYPFQIAFILLNLSAVATESHPERRVGDLLWFPTGGGKTEAYLGLAAFVMGLRRLRGEKYGMRGDRGVTVLMRYTLRLLTVQQFQRASTLICACEVIRKRNKAKWGAEPFSIGLWVGADTTPNSFEASDKALTEAMRDPRASVEGGTPVQITSCPWCGEPIRPRDYHADRLLARTLLWCPREGCDFSKDKRKGDRLGIPTLVVDEEIYRECPTLIVATVDKFARMPWRGEVQALFGRVDRYCERHGFVTQAEGKHANHQKTALHAAAKLVETPPLLPPELIIQDELHLITGPLGTLVGLYESAIDWLCAYRSTAGQLVLPKVVASTATIRRATEQVQHVYSRRLRTFPPPGIDAGDSFFAQDASVADSPGRTYLGVYAPGKSMKTAVARVYAASLAASGALMSDPVRADPYMTLVGYFNSLRELGGAVRLLEDDIPSWLRRVAYRGGPTRQITLWRELTSRVDSSQIPEVLDQLEWTFIDNDPTKVPIDVLLASNMISVGVDVGRLGLMVVTGQPKTTSEYIQATSRIGRRQPGLVIAIYNWSRFRDLSHYERFRPYHEALYRQVEGVSVTPYSSRARDRGLHAVFVSMTRLGVDGLGEDDAAVSFDPAVNEIAGIHQAIVERAAEVADHETAEAVRHELRARMDEWAGATLSGHLRYSWQSRYGTTDSDILLRPAGTDEDGLWPTLNSLREVEPQAGVFLVGD